MKAKPKRTAELAGKARAHANQLADRVARARAAQPPRDPTGEHHEAMADLARSSGREVVELLDLWDERAATREYEGAADRATAEREATAELVAMFGTRQAAFL